MRVVVAGGGAGGGVQLASGLGPRRHREGHDRAAGDGQEGAQAEEKPAVTWVHLRDISVWDMVDAAGRVFHVPENAALLAVLVVLLLKLSGVSGAICCSRSRRIAASGNCAACADMHSSS